MDINGTFFIQAFHFLIAYYLLEKFLCRPLVKNIQQEQKQYNDLIATLNKQQQLLIEKEKSKQKEWATIKRSFAQLFPSLVREYPHIPTIRKPRTINKEERQEYQKKIEELLFKRLIHVS